tara:strand:- start:451 stop:642 length:192 start_codon:yes stop_codon:yes gene_type:complete
MIIIPDVFYEKMEKISTNSPIVVLEGEIFGKLGKIHPNYHKKTIDLGTEGKIFNTSWKFGIMI